MTSNGSGCLRCWGRCGRRSWSPTSSILPLQRWDQRVRKWPAVAACAGAAERDVGGEGGPRRLVNYNAGISACAKGEQWQRALALLSEMWEAKLDPDVTSYSAGITACKSGGQWQRALALLTEMWEVKLKSTAPWSATALGSARARRAGSGSGL
ncbi:unnamed protein product [Prorocentrum cordatum]|uniref:Pentatricopeptide repeat-containing protein n=1 Tax=Prorocentrum cordatum TaxID=2364126 RepID=A0ABN9W0Y3_9DINO|nr:unnamed protein product [Polarella glacialis]